MFHQNSQRTLRTPMQRIQHKKRKTLLLFQNLCFASVSDKRFTMSLCQLDKHCWSEFKNTGDISASLQIHKSEWKHKRVLINLKYTLFGVYHNVILSDYRTAIQHKSFSWIPTSLQHGELSWAPAIRFYKSAATKVEVSKYHMGKPSA